MMEYHSPDIYDKCYLKHITFLVVCNGLTIIPPLCIVYGTILIIFRGWVSFIAPHNIIVCSLCILVEIPTSDGCLKRANLIVHFCCESEQNLGGKSNTI